MHWRRITGIGVIAIAIITLLYFGFQPAPEWVNTATVERKALRVAIEEEGKTRVKDRYVISAPVAGYNHRIEFEVGDTIQQSQTLALLEALPSAVLDPRSRAEAKARVEAAKAAFDAAREQAAAAKADAELAKINHQRIVDLCKVQCASKEEEDLALTRVRSTRALEQSAIFAVDIAQHELEAAKTVLAYAGSTKGGEQVNITAPISGSVMKIFRESEGVVAAGEPLLEVGNPQQLEVEVDVLSADAVRIVAGTRVLFERWGGDQPLEGRVRTIEPVGFTKVSALGVEEQRVLVISDLVSEPDLWQRLGDGYRVEASFILWEAENVLTIPASTLFRYQDGWAVFAVEADNAQLKKVEIGQRNGLQAQVLSGINENQRLITHPSEMINDGTKVQIR